MHSRELSLGDGIPATYLPSDDPAAPMIIFSNGYASSRHHAVPPGVLEDPISPLLVGGLLNAGYSVLVPEIVAHGERISARTRAEGTTDTEATTAELALSFRGIGVDLVDRTVRETAGLIDDALRLGLAPTAARIGVLGHSWGAFQSILRMCGDSRISCGIGVIPVIDPRCLDSFRALPASDRLNERLLLDRAIEELRSRPLLLIASRDDEVAPAAIAREFGRELAEHQAGLSVEYQELDGVGHHYSSTQSESIHEWLRVHLPVRDGVENGDERRTSPRNEGSGARLSDNFLAHTGHQLSSSVGMSRERSRIEEAND